MKIDNANTDSAEKIRPNSAQATGEIRVPRRRIDEILIAFGVVAIVVFGLAGGLLTWGSGFADDYVHDELSSQHVFFPDEAALVAEGRTDLVDRAGQQVATGAAAEDYASYIEGHLAGIAGGKTYSEIDDRGAAAAVATAKEEGASQATIDDLQATASQLAGQRDSLFKGETLRGLLLTSYAWGSVGNIAGIAAWAAFAASALMLLLTAAGLVHLGRLSRVE